VGTSAIPQILRKIKAPRLFAQLNRSKEKLKYSICFPKLTCYWLACRPAYKCGSLRLNWCTLYYQNLLSAASMDGSTRPARTGASFALRPHDQLKILSTFLHSPFPLSLPPFSVKPQKGGAFICRETKWITQARLPHFHSSGKSELPLDRARTFPSKLLRISEGVLYVNVNC
jgi:hypothetical protein